MKMTNDDYQEMIAALRAVSGTDIYERYYQSCGLSDKRYRWDMLYNAGLLDFVINQYAAGLDDSHIDSALRKYFSYANQ